MRESSQYVFIPAYVDAVPLLESLGATGLIIENSEAWTLVVVVDRDELEEEPLPLLLSYDFSTEKGFELRAFKEGELAAKVVVSADSPPRATFLADEWVEHDLLTKKTAKDLDSRLKKGVFSAATVRDEVAKAFGFRVEATLRGADLENDLESLRKRFGAAEYLLEGAQQEWEGDEDGEDQDDEDAVTSVGATKAPEPPKKTSSGKISLKEAEEISRAFRDAAPLLKPAVEATAADVDLASCPTPRAWLDTKNLIDPARASAAVIAELERTVREGRFPGAGDSAVVVREAAAMLLARCLHAQNEDDTESVLAAHLAKATTHDERSAWEASVARYRALRKGKGAPKKPAKSRY